MPTSRRAPPNRTIAVWTGPGGSPPATEYATNVPARWVASSHFAWELGPLIPAAGYFTMDAVRPFQAAVATIGSTGTILFDTTDQIASVSGLDPDYYVLLVETFFGGTAAEYYRVWVDTLPIPH